MKKRKEPARKTSVYLTKNNIEIIKGIQERYDLPVNRTINMCLTKYLPEMRVWIWYVRRLESICRCGWVQTIFLWLDWLLHRWRFNGRFKTSCDEKRWKYLFQFSGYPSQTPRWRYNSRSFYWDWKYRTTRMKDLYQFNLSVLIEKNRTNNEKKLTTEIEKMFAKNHHLREIQFVQLKKSR